MAPSDWSGTLRRLGYKTAILSGGFTFVGRMLQARLGIDYLHANELDIRDGVVTGEVREPNCRRRPQGASTWPRSRESRVSTWSRSLRWAMARTICRCCELAGLGIAFRAKPVVRQSARQSLSTLGLDGILYLIGVRDREAIV